MTQQVLPLTAAPVLRDDVPAGDVLRASVAAESPTSAALAKPLPTPEKPLAEQVQDAMTKLLGVSAQFKDLNGQDTQVSTREETVAMMQHYLARLGLTDAVNSQLSVIHIAGTKGKGSTCAMVERILREAGYKTGLFTSPHLISPCERFRINGKPIAEPLFLRHFDAVWRGLERTAAQSGAFPPMAWFFRFLTLLALHLFAAEQCDVVILEVGIGGRLDATNVVPAPVVCGITTLDLDHTQVLGSTLEQIAYAKGGILKPSVPAFTCAQEPHALAALYACATESKTQLRVVPSVDELGPDGRSSVLGMRGSYQRVNAGLAAALAGTWLAHHRRRSDSAIALSTIEPPEAAVPSSLDYSAVLEPAVRVGLERAFWPARSHVLDDLAHHARFYIDGAHTLRSLEVCAEWFRESVACVPASDRVLIFTIHHERNVASVIAPLLPLAFARVYFVKTRASRPSRAKVHTFSESLAAAGLDHVAAQYSREELAVLDDVDGKLQWQTTLARLWRGLKTHVVGEDQTHAEVHVRESVVDCINELRALSAARGDADAVERWSVLATGSLYLAGEALEFLGWRE